MTVEEYMWNTNENYNFYLLNESGDILSYYDGRNSIDEKYNDCKVISFKKDTRKKSYFATIEEEA